MYNEQAEAKNRKIYIFVCCSLLCLLVLIPTIMFFTQNQRNTRARAAGNMPHVQCNLVNGTNVCTLRDGFGNPLILKGAHIQSLLDRAGTYVTNSDKLAYRHLNSATFDVMVNDWNINVLRLATSSYLWNKSPKTYIQNLQNVVVQANQSGLYVIISNHEDLASGMNKPEPCGVSMPTSLSVSYWKAVALAFQGNPMVMFDVFNEPHINKNRYKLSDQDWQFWLNGGNISTENIPNCTASYQVLGMQTLVNAIRAQQANQVIIVEGLENWFQTIESNGTTSNLVTDPSCNCTAGNIVYSAHQYFQDDVRTTASWDEKFGNFASNNTVQQVPMLIGEWAFQANSGYPTRCDNITPSQAIQLVQSFLAYMDQRGMSWTTFAFTLNQMFTDYNHYTPTTLNNNWVCDSPPPIAGDGDIIKAYLLNGLQSFTPTPTP